MSNELTPYEQTYGAPLGKQPAQQPTSEPQGQPTPAPAPEPQGQSAPAPAPEPQQPDETATAQAAPASEPPAPEGSPVAAAQPAATGQAAPPPPPSAPLSPQRRVWPWVLLGCVVALLLLIGGCASCAVIGTIAALDDYDDRNGYDVPYDDSFGGYGTDDDYLYDDLDDMLDGYFLDDATFEDIIVALESKKGSYRGSSFGEGVYRVGDDGLEPGLYYLEGTQDEVGEYLTFDRIAHAGQDTYDLDDSVIYVGNYYTELREGDVIAFFPPNSRCEMHLASDEPMDVKAPYESGCYRVGIDIPAGTYTVTFEPEAAGAVEQYADGDCGAYVMDDLFFDRDSIVEQSLVIAGSKKTITVEEGQYLELIGAQASPKE